MARSTDLGKFGPVFDQVEGMLRLVGRKLALMEKKSTEVRTKLNYKSLDCT